MKTNKPIFNHVDCIRIYIPDLEKGLEYYHCKLGLQVVWKTDNAIGLLMNDSKTEIVIQNEDKREETDIKVDNVEDAIKTVTEAGSKVKKSVRIIREELAMETNLSQSEKNRIKKEVKEAFDTIIKGCESLDM